MAAETQQWFAALRVEVDVTPRWFAPGAGFHDDLLAILATWRDVGGDLLRMTADFQAGTSGVRLVLAVPVGVTFEQVEAARGALKTTLDALDLVSPRRRAVTDARATKRLQAAPSTPEAPPAPVSPSEPAEPPPGLGKEPPGEPAT